MVNFHNFEDYASKLLKIRDKEGKVVPFRLLPTQKVVMKKIKDQMAKKKPVRLVVLKARQQGISSLCVAFTFWKAVTTENYNAVVIAHDNRTSQRLLEVAGFMYDELPPKFKPMRRYRSKFEILFENPKETGRQTNPGLRSRIEIKTAGHSVSGRGLTIHGLHCSELSSYESPDELVSSLLPAVPNYPSTFILFESTASLHPQGVWFKEFWDASNKGETPFEAVFIPWFANPDYKLTGEVAKAWLEVPLDDYEKYLVEKYHVTPEQIAWRRYKISEFPKGERQFVVEYPSEPEEVFLGLGEPFIPKETSQRLLGAVAPPVVTLSIDNLSPSVDGELAVWEFPIPGAIYTVAADCASGYGSSNTAIQVVKVDLPYYKQVARASTPMDPVATAEALVKLARMYNEAMISVEANGVGAAVVALVRDKGYWKQFRWRYLDHDKGDYISRKLGWVTSPSSKPIMMQHLLHTLMAGYLSVPDSETVWELVRLVEDGRGAGEAPPGFKDDLAMSLAIAVYTSFLERRGFVSTLPEEEVHVPVGWVLSDIVPSLYGGGGHVY